MAAPPEARGLQVALQALKHPPDASHLVVLSRAVTRAADDLELVAEETSNRALRKDLLIEIAHARKAVTASRQKARQAALTTERTELLEGAQELSKKEPESEAARLARQINDSLRRTTAIVSEEIHRSRAAGDVVEESTRRLRMTRDQHGRYGEGLSSGADTLKSIRRTEVLANVLIIASFAVFFLAAAYVTRKRIANSNLSTFIFRPGMKVASIPVRIVGWMARSLGGGGRKGDTTGAENREVLSSAQQADEAVKAKEGREESGTVGDGQNNHKAEQAEVVSEVSERADTVEVETPILEVDSGSKGDNETCSTERECKSSDAGDTKEQNERTTGGTGKSRDSEMRNGVKAASQEPENHSVTTVADTKVERARSGNDKVDGKAVVTDDGAVDEESTGFVQHNGAGEPPVSSEFGSESKAATPNLSGDEDLGENVEEEKQANDQTGRDDGVGSEDSVEGDAEDGEYDVVGREVDRGNESEL